MTWEPPHKKSLENNDLEKHITYIMEFLFG